MRIMEHGLHYHVIARCNNGERLLVGVAECKELKRCLRYYLNVHKCKMYNYSIMPSHVHLMLMTDGGGRLDQFMHDWCFAYAQRFNIKHGRCGHFWRHRYRSKVIRDDLYALACLRYIDRNASTAGLVKTPMDWRWSGCRYYAYGAKDALLTPHPSYQLLGSSDEDRRIAYKAMLMDSSITPEDEFYMFESKVREGSKRYQAGWQRVVYSISSFTRSCRKKS